MSAKLKRVFFAALVAMSSGVAGSAAYAVDCDSLSPYVNSQQIKWSNGGAWNCISAVNADVIKYFSRGTAVEYRIRMSGVDNCKVYKHNYETNTFNYWFTPGGGLDLDIKNQSQIGGKTDGIRLGC